ncbi:putative RNase H-like HicB family nuclease [Flavobacterium sp. 102]|nr:putative RNase H-like HicB family nuclease [Flavobacterium sp. 102]
MEKSNLKVIIEKTENGFSAYSKDYAGIYTAADNLRELKESIAEVIQHQVDFLIETNEPKKAKDLQNSEIVYVFDFKQFFSHYPVLNKSEFAKYAGISPSMFKQYTASKPVYISEDRVLKIQKGLHKLADDLRKVQFA